MTTPLLDVRDLSVRLPSRRGDLYAVESASFHVNDGEIVGIAGESGSGKTLSVLSLVGLLPTGGLAGGTAMFGGQNLFTLRRKQLQTVRGNQIAMVFQDPMNSLHPMLTIGKQLTEHQLVHKSVTKQQARDRALELLDTVRIPNPVDAIERYPHHFSGGMRQRIAIAMALACEPKLLIADEPTTALDVTVQAGILRLINRLRREENLSVILITHDLGVLSSVADRLYIFYAGRVVENGTTATVLAQPRHPYTQGLLDALPRPEEPNRPLTPIAGSPPVLGARASGCPFHPRCRFAQDSCREQVPPLVSIADGREVACPPDPLRSPGDNVMTALLELRDVAVSYARHNQPPVRAVAGVDLSIDAGEILGLVGETGCGKSSLARAMVGLVAPESGEIRFEGERVDPIGRRGRQQAQRQLQMIFQDPSSSLNPRRKVGAQIQSAVLLASPDRADPKKQAAALLDQVGLPANAAERFPHEFSGGQRQRIAIARALAARPKLVVADEPIAALDASAQAQIANLLVELSRDLGLSLVFISHDLSIVRQVADVTAVMYLGKIVERAPTALLWDSPGHPYTRALTAAVPRVGVPGELPAELPGDVPDPARPPTGCRFHPRCPIAVEKCRTEEPVVVLAPNRVAYCWRSDLLPAAAGTGLTGGGQTGAADQGASTSS